MHDESGIGVGSVFNDNVVKWQRTIVRALLLPCMSVRKGISMVFLKIIKLLRLHLLLVFLFGVCFTLSCLEKYVPVVQR